MNTLADLYDPLSMPAELAKAHATLDRAVEKCYAGDDKALLKKLGNSDRERVEHLFRLYETLLVPLLPAAPRRGTRGAPGAPTAPRSRRSRSRGSVPPGDPS